MNVSKITPILTVEKIAPSITFWESIGFNLAVKVPDTNNPQFAILTKGNTELMYQTIASIKKDLKLEIGKTPSMVYLDVDNLDKVIEALSKHPIVVAKRTTFYGKDEVFISEPGGNVIGFAQKAKNE